LGGCPDHRQAGGGLAIRSGRGGRWPRPHSTEGSNIHTIACRARVSAGCLQDKPSSAQFGYDAELHEDGTFDGSTIVCDPCYVELMPKTPSGRGLLHELPAAIDAAHGLASGADVL
jgi:hypothetical protein